MPAHALSITSSRFVAALAGAGLLAFASAPAHAQQVSFDQGLELVTVGNPGNAPFVMPGADNNNRGRVDYEFRIGRYEVTTAQWAEFLNAAFDRPQSEWIPFLGQGYAWGGRSTTPNTPGGRRWNVPAGNEMLPVGSMSWRSAAIYCNWLHNGRSFARESFLSGAYDVTTFGVAANGFSYSDQLVRSPGARFFIPSLDEWMKAAHYDPQKQNPDGSVGGWWQFSNRSNTVPNYGPPGMILNGRPTEANANWFVNTFPGLNPYDVRLGAYSTVTNAYGLLDIAGGTVEWLEEPAGTTINGQFNLLERFLDGSGRDYGAFGGTISQPFSLDDVARVAATEIPGGSDPAFGFRIAAAIPSPGFAGVSLVVGGLLTAVRPRRRS